MKSLWKRISAGLFVTAVFFFCALVAILSGTPATSTVGEMGVEKAEASVNSSGIVERAPAEAGREAVEPMQSNGESPAPSSAVQDPAAQVPEDPPQAPGEQELPKEEPGAPGISAIDPSLPAPTGLAASFNYGWRTRRAELAWTAVVHPDLEGYYVVRWAYGDFPSLISIFQQLAAVNPAAAPFVSDLQAHFAALSQPGLTYTERNAILDDAEADMDQLQTILFATPGTESLVEQLIALAYVDYTTGTTYRDTGFSNNTYYLYVVAADYDNGDTSVPSNSGGVFAVNVDWWAPARPQGFTATAYDPGVALEWSRNTENDLAGYNVYVLQDGTPVQLNSQLVTSGTEFFHMAGVAGATYQVRAVDLWNRTSNQASAVSTLTPATVYDVDSPDWSYVGLWAREDYTETEGGGRVLRLTNNPGATASVTFTGRRVKVFSSRYWSCGNVQFYIDGDPVGTCNLYYDGGYYDYPNPYKPPLWQQQVFEVTGLSEGQHTLTIGCLGYGEEYGQCFINFDYVEVR